MVLQAVTALLLGQTAPTPHLAPVAFACLSPDEMRDVVEGGQVMRPADASRHAREAAPGEVLRIMLCRQDDEFVYVVTTLRRNGRVARVTLEGNSGKVSAIR